MITVDLESSFKEAVAVASAMKQSDIPQDMQLRLYAYYKQATFGAATLNQNTNLDLRNAFKTNAWMQVSHLSIDEAKELYIETIELLQK